MNLSMMSWPALLMGLGFLAAGLFVLQILRIRYREVTVVSTLLWRKAMQESPVRKFRERFRHPWAYVLVLAICSLIWLALAEPTLKREDSNGFHVLVLDGSAGMAVAERFDTAVQQLLHDAAALPLDNRQVLWSGAEVRTLLKPGEDALLLKHRLRKMKPEASPSNLDDLLGELAAIHSGASRTQIAVYGDAPIDKTTLMLLPNNISVAYANERKRLERNAGITALGIADAQSGQWDKVDAYFSVLSNDGTNVIPSAVSVDIDGVPVNSVLQAQVGRKGWLMRDLPAGGGLLTVRLSAKDDLMFDDTAAIRLPERAPIKVQLSHSLDSTIKAALLADPAIQITDSNAQVVIRNGGEQVGGRLPALELVAANRQQQAFVLSYPQDADLQYGFLGAVSAIGLRHIDAMALADAAQKTIEVGVVAGNQKRISLWRELTTSEFNFTRSSSFPLFVSNAVRWLADVPPVYPYVMAGFPLVNESTGDHVYVIDAQKRVIDPLQVAFVPEQAGELKLSRSPVSLSVSLLDPVSTAGPTGTAGFGKMYSPPMDYAGGHAVTALLLLALLLLGSEWYLHRNGRMP